VRWEVLGVEEEARGHNASVKVKSPRTDGRTLHTLCNVSSGRRFQVPFKMAHHIMWARSFAFAVTP